MKMKRCHLCNNGKGQERAMVLFDRLARSADGRAYACKACTAVKGHQSRRRNRGVAAYAGPTWSNPPPQMPKPVADVNFSDRTVRPKDPHRWQGVMADLVYQGRTLYSVPVWLCCICHAVSTLPPVLLRRRDGDFPSCITTWP